MKNKPNYFRLLIIISFFIFFISYLSRENGYYEYENYKKALITETAIQTFENDVKEGKNLNNKVYLEDEYKDYSSKASNLGIKSSDFIDSFMKKGFKSIINFIKVFFA